MQELNNIPSKCQHIHLETKMYRHKVTLRTELIDYRLTQPHDLWFESQSVIIYSAPQSLVLWVVDFFRQTMRKRRKVYGTVFPHFLQSYCSIPTSRSIPRRSNLRKRNKRAEKTETIDPINTLSKNHNASMVVIYLKRF